MFGMKGKEKHEVGEMSIKERNMQIALEYVEGAGEVTMKDLAKKYGVCPQRIGQIIAETGVLDKLEIRSNARVRLANIKMQFAATEAADKLVKLALKERGEKGVYADNQLLQQLLDRAGARVVRKEDNTMRLEIDFGEESGMNLGVPDHSKDNEAAEESE